MADLSRDKAMDIENLKYEVAQEMGLPQKKKRRMAENKSDKGNEIKGREDKDNGDMGTNGDKGT